jgi:hypothetical protein
MPTSQNQYGQIFGQGVKYIKINRYDSGGLDQSGYLGQLTNLTINYDDLGPIQYNIVTTQEQDTYFVYGIQTKNQPTSSVNYEVLNYKFTASYVGTPTQDGGNFYNWTTISDTLDYFDNINGSYTFGNTPNVPLKITITGSLRSTTPTSFTFIYNTSDSTTIISPPFTPDSFNSPLTIPEISFITTGSGLDTASIIENISHNLFCIDAGFSTTASITWSINIITS